MTFLEKAMENESDLTMDNVLEMTCPCDHGLEEVMLFCESMDYAWDKETCTKCWNREYPEPCKETTDTVEHDPVNHPSHYTRGMEAIDEMIKLNKQLYENLVAGSKTYNEFAEELLKKVPKEYLIQGNIQ